MKHKPVPILSMRNQSLVVNQEFLGFHLQPWRNRDWLIRDRKITRVMCGNLIVCFECWLLSITNKSTGSGRRSVQTITRLARYKILKSYSASKVNQRAIRRGRLFIYFRALLYLYRLPSVSHELTKRSYTSASSRFRTIVRIVQSLLDRITAVLQACMTVMLKQGRVRVYTSRYVGARIVVKIMADWWQHSSSIV